MPCIDELFDALEVCPKPKNSNGREEPCRLCCLIYVALPELFAALGGKGRNSPLFRWRGGVPAVLHAFLAAFSFDVFCVSFAPRLLASSPLDLFIIIEAF